MSMCARMHVHTKNEIFSAEVREEIFDKISLHISEGIFPHFTHVSLNNPFQIIFNSLLKIVVS